MKLQFRANNGEKAVILTPEYDSESKEINSYLGPPDSIITGSVDLVHSVVIQREAELFELIKKKMVEKNHSLARVISDTCHIAVGHTDVAYCSDEQLLEALRKG